MRLENTTRCPQCRKPIQSTDTDSNTSRYHPFCSKRCQLVDLNAWLDSDYRIESPITADDLDDLPMESL